MNRLNKIFERARRNKEGIFVAGIVPGYPDLQTSFEIAKTVIQSGADVLELSASFSDPVADGPTLQQAHAKVLGQGISKKQIFEFYKQIRAYNKDIPLFVIEYANCVYHLGISNYYRKLAASGVDALLIPDLSLEEAGPYLKAAKQNNINQVFIVAPTTPRERLVKISRKSKGFIYLVTITGVTGQRDKLLFKTAQFIKEVRQATQLPLIAGFGISKPEHVQSARVAGADGTVTCSAIVNLINRNLNKEGLTKKNLRAYIQRMKKATKKSSQ